MIKKLNNATTADSGFFAETYASKLTNAKDIPVASTNEMSHSIATI